MKFLLVLLTFLMTANSFAALKGAPFIPEEDQRFDALENQTAAAAAISRVYAKAVYDVAIQGGSSTSHDLGVVLPSGAVIENIHVYINTAFAQGTFGSVALQCYGTNDLMDWQDLTLAPANSMHKQNFAVNTFGTNGSVIPTGAAWIAVNSGASVPSACSIKAIVRSAPIPAGQANGGTAQTAGKLTAVIDYFIR